MQLVLGKEVEEKAERVAEDLSRECLALYFYLCSIERMLNIRLLFIEYRHQAHAQFKVSGDQVKARDEEIEAMTAGIMPVLDCIGFKTSERRELLPRDPPPRSILDRCRMAWLDFKEFVCSTAHGAMSIHLPSCGRTTLRWISSGW